jgi:TonB-dependent starch-binding outer membrane protein SusC
MRKVYNKMKRSALLMLWLATSHVLLAQDRTVSGTVKDEGGLGMPGVNVLLKGTSSGTATDATGQYKLTVAGNDAVLVFTFIGYTNKEVSVGSQSTVDVQMDFDAQTLTELVVTGYSVDKRRELTGSVSTVKPKDLTFAPSGNVEQMMQGRVAGVTVITNGQPGTNSQIRVRGFGAFGGNQPLYIVDGVPTDNVVFLNPDDIETMTVLKDAASASIYGARAASGVIVYTTKKGKKGQKMSVTYDNMYGVTTPGKGQPMMNPTDFADWTFQAIRNTAMQNGTDPNAALVSFNHPQFGRGPNPVMPTFLKVGSLSGASITTVDLAAEKLKYNVDPRNGAAYQVIRANQAGTDWYDEVTRNAPVLRQSLGFSGSGESHRYYIGLGMQDQKGILLANDFKRYSMRANTEFDVLKNLRIGENLQFTYRSIRGQGGANGGQGVAADENDILQAFRMPSIIPVYDEFGGYAGTAASGFNNPRNPVANRAGQENNKQFTVSGYGNIYMEYDPIPNLTLRTSIGGNFNSGSSRQYTRWQYENSENNSSFGYGQQNSFNFAWTFTNTANYKKTFGDHSVDVLAGQEALNTGAGWNDNQSGLNPFSWDPNYVSMTTVSSKVAEGNSFKGVNFSSYFGQVKYAFKEKYILGLVVRRDGSSRFAAANRYGVFPAVSAAWRVSSESFMSGLSFISDLKVRGGYGTMGNSNNVDPNNQFSLYGGNVAISSYDIGGTNSSAVGGFLRTRIGNPNAKWETSITKNIGIDGMLFDGKLDVIIDFWQKDTKDLLLQVPISATAGPNASPPAVNIAKMVNKGIDLMLGTKGNITQDLSFTANMNGSFLKNEITELAPGLTYLTTVNPGFRGIQPIRNQIGYSLSAFYGYEVIGLFQNSGEATSWPSAATPQPGGGQGRFKYADLNGDGAITPADRTYLGSPVPKFTGGFDFTLRMKGFDLGAYFYASIGNKIFNVSKWFTDFYPSFQGAAISERVKESWSPSNTGATIPIFESASNFSTNTQASSFYVEDGSYLRLQNITLGYTLPSNLLDKIKMTRLRAFVSANNLFTLSGYSGLDPAVGGSADTNFGIDVGNYPITGGYTLGVNVGF